MWGRESFIHRDLIMKTYLLKAVAAAACLFGIAWAQTTVPMLKEITVTANPLGATDLISPVQAYTSDVLLLRSKNTLGGTLDGTPGVSSTYFGPNASRPIIRGLDGDRIRILNNGGAALDASALSFDHAVTADPLSTERIEVLRGPGALLYGGTAVGGVVNVIDYRIAREALFGPPGGVAGKLDLNAASGNAQGAGAVLETGTDRFALHVDGFHRRTGDVHVPMQLSCTRAGVTTTASRICNSASSTHGDAVGGSVFFDHGYLGASVTNYQSRYGTVAEDEASIRMRSNRYALEGEVRHLAGPLQSVRGQYSSTDYTHAEFEGTALGTTFNNKGYEARIEARQAPWGSLQGVLGLQLEASHFSAIGTEAFAPLSRTVQRAAFAYEELGTSWGKLSFGSRVEHAQVQSFGNPEQARFVPARRTFSPTSWAAGALWKVAPNWELTSHFAATERTPKDYELFAYGPHLATKAYEIGSVNLGKERSHSVDLGASWKSGSHRFNVQAYTSRFQNYIALSQTPGVTHTTADGDELPEFKYLGVGARFVGAEVGGTIGLLEGANTLNLLLRADVVRATNLSNNTPLPRIAPARVGATLQWSQGPWSSALGFDHASAQTRVAEGQRATAAYTLWNASASYRMKVGAQSALWYAALDNLTNRLAYSATSVLTTTAFPKAPLPGRSVRAGVRLEF